MPAGNPDTSDQPANWSRINNGVPELIDQILVSHALVHTLDATQSLPIEGIKSVTADPASLADLEAPPTTDPSWPASPSDAPHQSRIPPTTT